jgi:uncharacterized protein YndB with AHSA1/START domain
MIDFTIDTEIERPPADVFAYATDPDKLATWQTNTVSAVPEPSGPLRVGSRIREVHRAPGGKEMPSLVEVSALEPDRAFALRMVEGALPIHADMTFEPTERGTLVRFRAHGQPAGAMRVAQPLLRRTLRKQFAEHCANLKHVLETA